MIVKRFVVGMLYTNCYIVGCPEEKEAIVIDPGFDRDEEANEVMKEISNQKLDVKYIINTHGHPDHISGNKFMKKATGSPILIHEYDSFMLVDPPADKTLQDGDIIKIGKVLLKVLHTPGHTRGSICILGEREVFTGDTLFAGSIGRTDLPGGSYEEIIRSLKDRLAVLPDHMKVYPGHGPPSTIGKEREINPFFNLL